MSESSGAGTAATPSGAPEEPQGTPEGRRVIQLLWDPHVSIPARGPKPRSSLADIVAAGVSIADAEGLGSLSMRKVAQHLGIGAMSIYTYVPGRSELIELMINEVYSEHTLPDAAKPWRDRIEHWSREVWRIYGLHPWLLDYNLARLPIGPHVLDVEEALYAALLAAGFTGSQNVAVANLIQWQLLGAARATISDSVEARHTGVSTEAYWESRASFWVTFFDPARFPAMAAVHGAGGFDDPAAWDFDQLLRRLLDGIERLANG